MLLTAARIVRPHGVRGEVSVEVRTDDPDRRLAPGCVLATDPPSAGPLTVTARRWHSGRLLLRLQGVGTRDAAEALRGVRLLVDADPEPASSDGGEPADAWYDHELVGLVAQLPDGSTAGVVRDVLHGAAQDLLVVARPDGTEALVPFVAAIVPTVDTAAGRVLLDPPPGLLDLGAPPSGTGRPS